MHKFFFIALLFLSTFLSGCATALEAGNFTQDASASFDKKIANDAVNQLAALYPPAHTRFDLQQATPDAFGQLLLKLLRARGYAVSELSAQLVEATQKQTGRKLRYVLDKIGDSDLYRITLFVSDQSLTRVYVKQKNGVLQAGTWTRKE